MQPEQVAKVRGDLGVTQQNMAVFSEMLSELKPGLEHPEVCKCQSSFKDFFQDRSMFEALHATCRAMQSRLVELIDQVEDDKLTADLLEVNDDMNNLFLRYDRYEKNKSQSQQAKQGAIKKSPSARPAATEAPLIDFSTPQTIGATAEPASLAPSLANFKVPLLILQSTSSFCLFLLLG